MDKNTVVIAIDHGWSNMKTVHETFTSGIREVTTEPALFENVLEKDGKYYKVGSERLKVKDSKVEDENYYLLSLAATAKELDRLGKRTANVYWAVGLPLTRFGKEKEAFIKYLDQNREVTFKYEKKQYHITIERISVYPQCFAAVASQISEFPAKVLVVDIGSWTVDLMPIINQSPDESVCVTKNSGIITCIQQINKESVSVHAVPKVNRTLHALTVMLPDHNKAPNIYLEEMYEHYQQNEDIQTTLAEVADAVVEATKEMSKVNPVLDVDKIQDNVVLCLVNSTQNEELLKEVPNRSFQDLSVIYRWVVCVDQDGMQSMIITNDFAAARGFTEEELFQHAVENTKRICPPRVKSMQEVMADLAVEDGMPQELLYRS